MVEFLAKRLTDLNMGRPQPAWRERFDTPDPLERHTFEQNAMLESLLLHVRQLTNFLFEPSPPSERRKARAKRGKAGGLADAFAEDYFENPIQDWRKHPEGRRKRPKRLQASELNRINREVAHLTYDRAGFEHGGSNWSAYGLYTAVADPMERFAELVDPARVLPDFKERVAAAMYPRQPKAKPRRRPGGSGVWSEMPVATQGMFPPGTERKSG